jgi:stearoyl-CoA desaturase (delta-9 desaturase)
MTRTRTVEVAIQAPTQKDWTNILFVGASHLVALAALAWVVAVRTSPSTIALGVLWFALCGIAITGGYHRLFAHATYRTTGFVRAFYLVFGGASVQNSALKWAADHRVHHAKTDEDEDPYNIRRGFWWAHMGWVFHRDAGPVALHRVKDLVTDPLLRWQDRHYLWIAALFGGVLPGAIGMTWGDPIGAVLVAGFLRLVLQWHATGAVNSFAHRFGGRPYTTANSARDSSWTALLTLGEGYHNFHHRFQGDYRNGIRWWHFDPTKWFVWTLARVGLARDLRRASDEAIDRARERVRAVAENSRRDGPRSGAGRIG